MANCAISVYFYCLFIAMSGSLLFRFGAEVPPHSLIAKEVGLLHPLFLVDSGLVDLPLTSYTDSTFATI